MKTGARQDRPGGRIQAVCRGGPATRTRSGKILRATIVKGRGQQPFKPPATIGDPAILDEIKLAPAGAWDTPRADTGADASTPSTPRCQQNSPAYCKNKERRTHRRPFAFPGTGLIGLPQSSAPQSADLRRDAPEAGSICDLRLLLRQSDLPDRQAPPPGPDRLR